MIGGCIIAGDFWRFSLLIFCVATVDSIKDGCGCGNITHWFQKFKLPMFLNCSWRGTDMAPPRIIVKLQRMYRMDLNIYWVWPKLSKWANKLITKVFTYVVSGLFSHRQQVFLELQVCIPWWLLKNNAGLRHFCIGFISLFILLYSEVRPPFIMSL